MLTLLQESNRPDGDYGPINANAVAGRFFDATVTNIPWIGGMPLGMTAASTGGLVAGATALGGTTSAVDSNNIVGLSWNNSIIDTARGSGIKDGVTTDRRVAIPTVVYGVFKCDLFAGEAQGDAGIAVIGGPPFKADDAWANYDLMYICSGGAAANAGKWTRTAGSGNFARPFGRVLSVTASGGITSLLRVEFWGFIQGATTTFIPA